MNVERNINITKTLLYLTNFFNTLIISFIIYKGNETICWNGYAREFLENASQLPVAPKKIIFLNIILLLILFISIYIRDKYLKNKKFILELFFFFDMFICIISIISLKFSYKGVILVAVTNLILYVEPSFKRYFYLCIPLLTYILLDYDTLSVNMNIIPFNKYVQFFNSNSKLYIYSMKSIFNSINQVLFIGFMSFSLQKHIKEKKEIKNLYQTLMKTTKELSLANIQLENYAKKSEAMAQIKERNRLAREIHDTVGHSLTGIVTGLEACKTIIDLDVKTAKNQIEKISELGRKGLLDIRRSVKALRPDALERFSLGNAIKKMAEDIMECTDIKIEMKINNTQIERIYANKKENNTDYTDVKIEMKINNTQIEELCANKEEIIYRIIQESLTNSVRHGKSKFISINIFKSFENNKNYIIIDVKDNGNGSSDLKEGFGLKHIRERTNLLGGEFKYGNNKNKGFFIYVKIPFIFK